MDFASICVSHRLNLIPTLIEVSSYEDEYPPDELFKKKKKLFWLTKSDNKYEYIIIKLDDRNFFNHIKLSFIEDKNSNIQLPKKIRIEIGNNRKEWRIIVEEENLLEGVVEYEWHLDEVKSANFLKFIFLMQGNHKIAIKDFLISILGAIPVEASSELNRNWVKENILDGREDYGWATKRREENVEDYLILDLRNIFVLNQIKLLSSPGDEVLFPKDFAVQISEKGDIWTSVIEETDFFAEPGTWYVWDFFPQKARYIRILIKQHPQDEEGNYISKIIEIKVYATFIVKSHLHLGIEGTNKYASIYDYGVVRLSKLGEYKSGRVVQADDPRLKPATTERKGIVELAEDGEDKEGVVVQGSDSRLKPATTNKYGIVKIARDGDDTKGLVVEASDSRLKPATEYSYGIMKFCRLGEDTPYTAVQGNDPRLRDKREPLPHTHPYAPINHSFDSHTGELYFEKERVGDFDPHFFPNKSASIIAGINKARQGMAIGVLGAVRGGNFDKDIKGYGILGYSPYIGVAGISAGAKKEESCGVYGFSRSGIGGFFVSYETYSAVIGDKESRLGALLKGLSSVEGNIEFIDNRENQHIAIFVETEMELPLDEGDVVIVKQSEKDDRMTIFTKSYSPYDKRVIGVVSKNPKLFFRSLSYKKGFFLVVMGIAMCNVDATKVPVYPGDMLVSSSVPGYAQKGEITKSENLQAVIGKALLPLKGEKGKIPVLIK